MIIKNEEQINNPNCVKCVFDNNNNALYFSRCPIPYARNANNAPYFAHIGIYGYKKESLIKMTQLPQSYLEKHFIKTEDGMYLSTREMKDREY